MRRAVLLLACVVFLAFGARAIAATAPAKDFPTGFSVPADFREDIKRRQYWDFDTAQLDSQHKAEGHLWRFAVTALTPNNNADVIVGQFASDLEKAGWTILRRQGTLVAHRTDGPELWLNGAGNSGDFRLVLIEVAAPARAITLSPPAVKVETVADTDALPYLEPLPGSKMDKTIHDQRAFEIRLPNATETTLAISDMTRWYEEPAGVSSYEFATVYRTALAATGWDITKVQVGGDAAITAHYGKNGRDIWLYTHSEGNKQSINVVDHGAESRQSALASQLAKAGHVALYGIYFDTDSSVPRPESQATLQNVLEMLNGNAPLKLEIQGHTDNSGSAEHNATLSDARAASVVTWLTAHGIDAVRLVARGYGATLPVADNNTPEGRAKNRRVELANLAGGASVMAGHAGAAAAGDSNALPALPKGTVLGCTPGVAKDTNQPFSITNSTGKPLKKDTIVNTVLTWKGSASSTGRSDCFALGSDLAPKSALVRSATLDAGAVGVSCQAYVSARHPSVVRDASGGQFTECDPP